LRLPKVAPRRDEVTQRVRRMTSSSSTTKTRCRRVPCWCGRSSS
jgi:hypothetical protein